MRREVHARSRSARLTAEANDEQTIELADEEAELAAEETPG
jgi:hypothetical protein